MDKNEDSGSLGWRASFFIQTTEDVARGIAAAASAATTRSTRPPVIFSSKEDGNSQLQKLQRQVTRVLKGFSSPPQVSRGAYNPEILTSQKRQWARFQLQSMDHRIVKDPSRIFESLVVVGLHPDSDVKTVEKPSLPRNFGSMNQQRALNYQHQIYSGVNLEPQVLFAYPPEKQLPLKYRDLLSFCFPGGLEIHAVERTPSMSELSEILLGQEHLKQNNLSFVFRCLQVADDSTSTLYGCCILVEEIVQKPSSLISMLYEEKSFIPSLSRHIITAPRCYCILSRLPFFDLHFGVLKSIFIEERLQCLTEGIDVLNLRTQEGDSTEVGSNMASSSVGLNDNTSEIIVAQLNCSEASHDASAVMEVSKNYEHSEGGIISYPSLNEDGEIRTFSQEQALESGILHSNGGVNMVNKASEKNFPEAVLPLLRFHQCESSESTSSLQGSPSEEQNLRSGVVENQLEEPSSSGQEECSDHNDILSWAKANNHGCLQIVCEYYQLCCPPRGSTVTFHPLEHLHPLKYHRPNETLLHLGGSTVELRNCSTSLELAEAHNALFVEEEATALSIWTIACVCGSLRLENIVSMFAGALLEKQIIVVCSNLGILSASVLSIISLIRPYQWQSLLMPVLPSDMLDFLDAPVPYIVGIINKAAELQSKLANAIIVDANKNQVKSPSLPQLPQQKELFSSLSTYHSILVGESYLARKRPVYECTDKQGEAAKGFLTVIRSYLDSLCSNLRSHTITNVQSNDDKVSLLLKESFIDSFPTRDRPFMKLFVDTQLFSMHTDLVLSFYQKD